MSTPVVPDRSAQSTVNRTQHDRTASHIIQMLQSSAEVEIGSAQPMGVTRDILSAILDVFAMPVVVADRHLSIVYANKAAHAVLASGGAIRDLSGRLATAVGDQPKLSNAVNAAALGHTAQPPFIFGSSEMSPVAIWVQPVDALLRTSAPVWARGLAVLTLKPLRGAAPEPSTLLIDHYELTQKQAEVVAHLAGGATLDEVAEAMNVRLATVRSHLAACFLKTGTHRQPDLVSLALSLQSPILV